MPKNCPTTPSHVHDGNNGGDETKHENQALNRYQNTGFDEFYKMYLFPNFTLN